MWSLAKAIPLFLEIAHAASGMAEATLQVVVDPQEGHAPRGVQIQSGTTKRAEGRSTSATHHRISQVTPPPAAAAGVSRTSPTPDAESTGAAQPTSLLVIMAPVMALGTADPLFPEMLSPCISSPASASTPIASQPPAADGSVLVGAKRKVAAIKPTKAVELTNEMRERMERMERDMWGNAEKEAANSLPYSFAKMAGLVRVNRGTAGGAPAPLFDRHVWADGGG